MFVNNVKPVKFFIYTCRRRIGGCVGGSRCWQICRDDYTHNKMHRKFYNALASNFISNMHVSS
jgi:hypothetical protein